jgi:hypothetical protein
MVQVCIGRQKKTKEWKENEEKGMLEELETILKED